ncbi:hypothetical protein B296_00016702 [Ensete ventricosum]|uniref:40S ribosomal protein S3a n=1 Tax=Ensete ventricosum TaxID=4639 RepID=A0A427ALE7_ENSVE|nr:hypothetical protein B296_00016702 [Ensete ventricosum]
MIGWFCFRVDPFSKKDWYDIKAPSVFNVRNIGKTLVSRTQGTKVRDYCCDLVFSFHQIASEGLKHRVFEVSLADLQNDEDQAHRKIRLRSEDVQGKNVLTNFWVCNELLLKNFWVMSSVLFQIRRKMREIMVNQATTCDLKDLVLKFIPDVIGKEIEKATSSIFPLQNVYIRKVKILKAPKFDLGKLMEVHGDYNKEDVGVKVDRPAEDVQMEGEAEVVGA